MFLPAFPKVPPKGKLNALVLNHRSGVGFASRVFPVTLGRSFAPKPSAENPVPLLSNSRIRATVNGRPVCAVTIPAVCQPLHKVDQPPPPQRYLRPLPKGRS